MSLNWISMKKSILALLVTTLLISCADGDIILTSFDFGDSQLEACGGAGGYVFFKINNDAAESIALELNTEDELFLESSTRDFVLDGSFNKVNYRSFSDNVTSEYFCSNIPPTEPMVVNDYLGSSGTATLTTTTVLDDNDLIEFVDSDDLNLEGFGDLDNDGLANYYDEDDDGDNVPTAGEIGDDPENPLDTDGDGIFNYLDEDDDGDGVLTRYEVSSSDDLDPTDDITDPDVGPNYLNPDVSTEVIVDQFRIHNYSLNSDISLFISNLVLSNGAEQITQESLNMGSITDIVNITVTLTPAFPD